MKMMNENGMCEMVVGCVSYFNSKLLVDGLEEEDGIGVRYAVPSGLLDELLGGRVDVALCPAIDYQLSDEELSIVPVGGICSFGETLTVRVFSRVPLDRVRRIHADVESHSSVILARIVFADVYGIDVEVVGYDGSDGIDYGDDGPEAVLLIGDKVVRNDVGGVGNGGGGYCYGLDLGNAWRELTGLPFVFAIWMKRRGLELYGVEGALARRREINVERIDEIVAKYGRGHGWSYEMARDYLTNKLHYEIGEREIVGMREYFGRAARLGLIAEDRELVIDMGDGIVG